MLHHARFGTYGESQCNADGHADQDFGVYLHDALSPYQSELEDSSKTVSGEAANRWVRLCPCRLPLEDDLPGCPALPSVLCDIIVCEVFEVKFFILDVKGQDCEEHLALAQACGPGFLG